MKLQRLLITALLLAASIAFAAPGNSGNAPGHNKDKDKDTAPGNSGNAPGHNKDKDKDTAPGTASAASVQEFFSLEKEAGMKSLYVTVFRMNNGWTYDVNGYSEIEVEGEVEGEGSTEKVKTFTGNLGKSAENAITMSGKKAKEYAATLENVPDDIKAGLEGHAIGIYQFEILIPDDVVEITLSGGKGKGNFTESIYNAATNGNDFYALEGDADDGIVYFGKSNWIDQYNNGAIFLISGKKTESMGAPLPTPVVTLLIALGFGAAFVMYRNRKQVKA